MAFEKNDNDGREALGGLGADSPFAPRFTLKDVSVHGKVRSFKAHFAIDTYTVSYSLFTGGRSGHLVREIFERDQNAVAVLPYDPKLDRVLLLEQFRPGALNDPVSPWLIEIVAGMIDAGETPQQAALRELAEEARLKLAPGDLHYINTEYPSPGGASETVTLYVGVCDLSHAGDHGGLKQEGEDLRLFTCQAQEAFRQVKSGRICNAAALIGLMHLQIHHDEFRALGQKS